MTIQVVQVPYIGTNCYLVMDEDTQKGAIIDPGGGAESICDAVKQMGMRPEVIFLTHAHYDHTGAVAQLCKEYPEIPVYLHTADAAKTQKGDYLMPDVGETVPYDEGDEVCVGNMAFRVMHTPGHTPGSVVLDAGEVLFTGDTLFAGSCGRTDLPGGSPDLMATSLKRLAQMEGDRQVLPGHEGFSTLAKERTDNYWILYAMKL